MSCLINKQSRSTKCEGGGLPPALTLILFHIKPSLARVNIAEIFYAKI